LIRQPHIHQHQIGLRSLRHPNRLVRSPRLTDDRDSRLTLKQGPQSQADHVMIVNQQ
jgi:hypothetical protein